MRSITSPFGPLGHFVSLFMFYLLVDFTAWNTSTSVCWSVRAKTVLFPAISVWARKSFWEFSPSSVSELDQVCGMNLAVSHKCSFSVQSRANQSFSSCLKPVFCCDSLENYTHRVVHLQCSSFFLAPHFGSGHKQLLAELRGRPGFNSVSSSHYYIIITSSLHHIVTYRIE